MAQEALITVQRGHNIGQSIIDFLVNNQLRDEVNILTISFERIVEKKVIKVVITYVHTPKTINRNIKLKH